MRVGHLQTTRPDWYDRVVQGIWHFSELSTNSAIETNVWSYTVPSNTKAYLESAFTMVNRRVASSAGAPLSYARISYTNSTPDTVICHSEVNLAAAGGNMLTMLGQSITLLAGDNLVGRDRNDSADGETVRIISAKLTEFNA